MEAGQIYVSFKQTIAGRYSVLKLKMPVSYSPHVPGYLVLGTLRYFQVPEPFHHVGKVNIKIKVENQRYLSAIVNQIRVQ